MIGLVRMVIFLSLLSALFISAALALGQQIVLKSEALRIELQAPYPPADFMRWYLSEPRRGLRVDLTKTGSCIQNVISKHGPANPYYQCPLLGRDESGLFVMDAVSLTQCHFLA